MGVTEKNILCRKLQENKLCQKYWSEQIENELEKDIRLTLESVGEMAIYSKHFEFHTQYGGDKEELCATTATIKISITANIPEYDLKKAEAGTDCFHNVRIIVYKEGKKLLTAEFRLWDKKSLRYSGKETVLEMLLRD